MAESAAVCDVLTLPRVLLAALARESVRVASVGEAVIILCVNEEVISMVAVTVKDDVGVGQ